MRKQLPFLLLFLIFRLIGNSQTTLYSFDSGVPSNFTASNSTLVSSTDHIKKGSSLAWSVSSGAVLTASSLGITSSQTGNWSTSAAQFYVYNSVPSNDTLVFSFYTNGNNTPQRVGHMLLNFSGWRDYHRSYRFDYANGQDIGGGFTFDIMTITYKPVNSSSTPTLYLDEFTMVGDANTRQPGPHMQIDLKQFSPGYSFLEPLKYFLNAPPTTAPPTPTSQEQTDAATVKSKYPRSIPSVSSTNLTNAKNYVTGCGIYRNTDGSINGTRGLSYLHNLDTLVQIGNYVGYLTEAAVNNNDADAKSKLLLFTEYILDQGLAEGGRNNVPTNDYTHCQNLPVGFLQAVNSGLLTDSLNKGMIKMLKWSNGYNIIYNSTGSLWVMTDYILLKTPFLLELAGDTTVAYQVSDYHNISNFLSVFANIKQGGEDGIKPDGVGFHHNFNNLPYFYAWGAYADRVNSLKGTVFRITPQAFNNMSGSFKAVFLEQSNASLIPNSLCGRHPFDASTLINQTQFQEMVNVGGDVKGTTIDTALAQLYNYIYQTSYYSVPTVNYDSFYHYNYTQLGVKKRGNWMVAVKGLTNTLPGTEIYSNSDRYGRYQSYGSLEVLYNGAWSANGGINYGAGWDWNVYPGTTTVQLPWTSLQPLKSIATEYQNNSFSGALSLGNKYGIFAIDFLEKPNGNYTANNLKFKKTVFTFDSIFVCLGSSISSTNGSNITSTNLFQAIDTAASFAPIYVNSTTAVSSSSYSNTISTSSGSAWMVTGQTTGYYIPQGGGTVSVLRGSQTTPDQSDTTTSGSPHITNTANYSKAYISHGAAPANGTYQFVMVPGTTPSVMQTLAVTLDGGSVYTVLKQTDSLHAVFYRPDSVTAYAFFNPNNNVNIGYIKSISNKGLVGVKKKGDTLTLTVNNPDLNVVTDASDSVDLWHSTPQNISLVLNGSWVVLSNNSSAAISQANNTLTAGFTLKDGFSGSLTLVVAKPPTVAITAPANNAAVIAGSNITLTATASSPNAGGSIAKVDFYNGSTLLGTSTTSPYSYTWNNVAAGTDTLTAVATDNLGLTTTSSAVRIIVSIPPTVSITAPANNSIFTSGSNITLSANATSPNAGGSITKVDFYQGSTLLGTSTISPYSYTWNNVANGSYALTAVATDNNGLTTTSSAINIQVKATSFAPAADAYVRNGTYANTNYGTDTILEVKNDSKTSFYRESYLRFDYSSYTGSSVGSATLKLYVSSVNTDPSRVVSVYGITDTTWGETSITYNNQPTEAGTFIRNDTISNTSGVWYSFDVTSYINSQLAAGHKRVSFRLINNGAVSSKGSVTFNSREASSNNPQLVFTPNNQLPMVSSPMVSVTTQVAREESNFGVKLYPNPSATTFKLEIPGTDGSAGTDLRIINVHGRTVKVLSMASGSTIQFGNDLRPGIYFVEVLQGINKKVLKIIKL